MEQTSNPCANQLPSQKIDFFPVSLTLTLISSTAFWQVAVCRKTAVSTHNILSMLPELELQKSGDKSMVYKPHHSLQTSLRRFLFCLLSITTHNPNPIEVELLVTDPNRNIQEVQITSSNRQAVLVPEKRERKKPQLPYPTSSRYIRLMRTSPRRFRKYIADAATGILPYSCYSTISSRSC
jgi:hypothetical protein